MASLTAAQWSRVFRHASILQNIPKTEQQEYLKGVNSDGEDPAVIEMTARYLHLPPVSSEHSEGEVINGNYRLKKRIKVGGMGEVWLAIDQNPIAPHDVAIKFIRMDLFDNAQSTRADLERRFEKEISLLSELKHRCIATMFTAGRHNTHDGEYELYCVMEYIPQGQTIIEYAKANDLTITAKLDLIALLAEGLHHVHQEHKTIHSDIKPDNILMDSYGMPRLIDFGLARALGEGHDGFLAGTPQYMSPEQISGEALDARSDVYQLGLILCELLTGNPPYSVPLSSLSAMKNAILSHNPKRPKKFLRGSWPVVEKALQKDPGERFPTARALCEAIRHVNSRAYLRTWWRINLVILVLIGCAVIWNGTRATNHIANPAISSPATTSDRPRTVKLIGPGDERKGDPTIIVTTQPTFSWEPVPSVTFRLYVSDEEGNSIYDGDKEGPLTGTSFVLPPGSVKVGKTYKWNMKYVSAEGKSSVFSPARRFAIHAVGVPSMHNPGKSAEPGTEISTLTPVFDWSPAAGATGYGLFVVDVKTGRLVYDSTTLGGPLQGTSFSLPSGVLQPGVRYKWNMVAFAGKATGAYCKPALFFQTSVDAR